MTLIKKHNFSRIPISMLVHDKENPHSKDCRTVMECRQCLMATANDWHAAASYTHTADRRRACTTSNELVCTVSACFSIRRSNPCTYSTPSMVKCGLRMLQRLNCGGILAELGFSASSSPFNALQHPHVRILPEAIVLRRSNKNAGDR